jgi:hypothetical protein
MMEIIQKFLLILVTLNHDGSFSYEKTLVNDGCPPAELITINMNTRQKAGEFVSWDGLCFPLIFKKGPSV